MRKGLRPVGSRRRRAALQTSDNIPFEQLPYQCFQEARKILQEDREEKLKAIETERARILRLSEQDVSAVAGGEKKKPIRLDSMRRHLEKLKILADINDPLIKKRFEDGEGMSAKRYIVFCLCVTKQEPGDMNKPIYRYLADKKWRSYQRLLITQRVSQFNIVPDVLPFFEPTADVRLAFGRRNVQPGDFVDSRISEIPARLKVQVFNKGERLVSVVVVDSDVPVVEEDNFTSRCHYIATNIAVSPTQTSLPLSVMSGDTQLVLPWLPPHAQKGSPYHRLSVWVMEQQSGQTLNVDDLKERVSRDNFSLRSFADKYDLHPIGIHIFRSIWDEGTAGVMHRAGIEGADIELKRKKVVALKPKQKARGWAARHASDKYKPIRR